MFQSSFNSSPTSFHPEFTAGPFGRNPERPFSFDRSGIARSLWLRRKRCWESIAGAGWVNRPAVMGFSSSMYPQNNMASVGTDGMVSDKAPAGRPCDRYLKHSCREPILAAWGRPMASLLGGPGVKKKATSRTSVEDID